jgi:hypothetical protein
LKRSRDRQKVMLARSASWDLSSSILNTELLDSLYIISSSTRWVALGTWFQDSLGMPWCLATPLRTSCETELSANASGVLRVGGQGLRESHLAVVWNDAVIIIGSALVVICCSTYQRKVTELGAEGKLVL